MEDLAALLSRANPKQIEKAGEEAAKELGLKWYSNIAELILCLKKNPDLIPGKITGIDLKSALAVWLKKYKNGLSNRFRTRVAKPSLVKRDPVLKHVVKISNPKMSAEEIEDIFEHHAMAMAIENNIGSLLEDYVAASLEPKGWISAWGSTLRAVDFYKPQNNFLQVKNRSNSENSSSSSIRKGTAIKKWFRIEALTGKAHWDKLEDLTGVAGMSETGFFKFIEKAIKLNPKLFYFGAIKSD